ncbi:hypothetical protein C805_01579 [Eubacterium sp. 14-2]|uniref:MFS transporter n=1 Tax=Eubacterium sp. 14-2 TaxID=1235790 RepID=UPI00034066ED|nr:MFS transporter [Eubacterium sp. 14-2]EOT27471.1 hypothetical protein C805_01579 [Eubacterium sp. 14-2]
MNSYSRLNSNFKRIFLSDNLSFIMNRVILFAMPLWIMEVTGSAVVLSVYNSIIVSASVLISPVMGILSDRLNKVKIIKSGNVLKLFSVLIIFLLFQEPEKNVYLIIGAFLLRHLCISIINPSTSSLIVHIVDKNDLENAVYLQQLTTQILQILSPTIAGILISVLNYRNIYLADMGVVLIVLLLLSGLSYEKESPENQKKKEKDSSPEVLKKHPARNSFLVFLLCASVINVLGAALILSMQVYVINHEVDKILAGILFAASPLGGVIGSLLAKKTGLQKFQIYHSMIFVSLMGVFNVIMGILAYYQQTGYFIAAYFISGIFFGLSNTQFGIFYKKYIPQEVQGRFFGFLNSILLMATPVGTLVNGFFIETTSAALSIFILGLTTCTSGMIFAGITRKIFQKTGGKFYDETREHT